MQLRIPTTLQKRLKDAGRDTGRSLRGELLARLNRSLDGDDFIRKHHTAREIEAAKKAISDILGG